MSLDRAERRYQETIRRVREAREQAGLTQEVVAERLGMSGGGYSQWETGKRRIPITDLFRLADVLGVRATYLLANDVREQAEVNDAEVMLDMLDRDPHVSPSVKEIAARLIREDHRKWREEQERKERGGRQ